MRIESDVKLDFDDVLIRPKRSLAPSRSAIKLERPLFRKETNRGFADVFPLIIANMDTTGTIKMCQTISQEKALTCLHKHYSLEDLVGFFSTERNESLYAFYTMGIKDEDFDKLKKFIDRLGGPICAPDICVDAANGYTKYFVDRVAQVRELCNQSFIMAGNVCTPDMVQELVIQGGADCIKIGIGPGSCCTTRIVTGVGYPQLSSIIECADAAHGNNAFICADGGCRTSGDVAKAFAAGADFVMVGGMLSGCDECEGDWITEKGEKFFKFYGMSSEWAMQLHGDGMSDYKASEGKLVKVPAKGSALKIVKKIKGGLRSACAYVGAERLKDLSKCTTFVRVNRTHNTVYG